MNPVSQKAITSLMSEEVAEVEVCNRAVTPNWFAWKQPTNGMSITSHKASYPCMAMW